jgi:hypothetical protein
VADGHAVVGGLDREAADEVCDEILLGGLELERGEP